MELLLADNGAAYGAAEVELESLDEGQLPLDADETRSPNSYRVPRP